MSQNIHEVMEFGKKIKGLTVLGGKFVEGLAIQTYDFSGIGNINVVDGNILINVFDLEVFSKKKFVKLDNCFVYEFSFYVNQNNEDFCVCCIYLSEVGNVYEDIDLSKFICEFNNSYSQQCIFFYVGKRVVDSCIFLPTTIDAA